jgi:trans-2,3-dihydro-3-hydroxyanthranilate isomerase
MFALEYGIAEDPAAGSSTGPVVAYMIRHKLVSGQAGTRFVSEQGTKMAVAACYMSRFREDDGVYSVVISRRLQRLS